MADDQEHETNQEPADDDFTPIAEMIVDGFYTAVGLGVLAVNRVQVARRDAARRSESLEGADPDRADEGWERFSQLVSDPETVHAVVGRLQSELRAVDDLVIEVEQRLDDILDRIEPDLPDSGRELVQIMRSTGKDLSTHYRAVLGLRVP